MASKRPNRGLTVDGGGGFDDRGGVGTFRGVSYQVQVAIDQALDLVERQIAAPHLELAISLEGLVISDDQIEKWDVVAEPDRRAIEAKVKPTTKDVRKFCAAAADSHADQIVLVFGENCAAVRRLERLRQARRAAPSEAAFERILADFPDGVRKLAGDLGDRAFDVIDRVELVNQPPGVLRTNVERHVRDLAPAQAAQLSEFLVTRLTSGAEARQSYRMRDLLTELAARGITITTSRGLDNGDLSRSQAAVLGLLWSTAAALPTEILADTVGIGVLELKRELEPLIEAGVLTFDGSCLRAEAPLGQLDARLGSGLAEACLDLLLVWLKANPADRGFDGALDAAIALASRLSEDAPTLVATVFHRLDKLLKRRGDKRLVLEVADLSIAAAHCAARTDPVVQGEAVALICGRAWVYQRVGELDRAAADSEASLELGEQIGWERNTAYCHKCIGRLCRVRAEATAGGERDRLLAESRDRLREAIERFRALGRDEEVGDSFSLLGRTELVAGDRDAAEAAVIEAARLLTDRGSKDFLDLELLRAELAQDSGQLEEAEEIIAAVLAVGGGEARDDSEISGRALGLRGRVLTARGQKADGQRDLLETAALFERLGEPDRGAAYELEAMKSVGRLPDDVRVLKLLREQRPLVQTIAISLYEQDVRRERERAEQAVALRAPAPEDYWRTLISRAREDAARRREDWR